MAKKFTAKEKKFVKEVCRRICVLMDTVDGETVELIDANEDTLKEYWNIQKFIDANLYDHDGNLVYGLELHMKELMKNVKATLPIDVNQDLDAFARHYDFYPYQCRTDYWC